jgi:hypothetical protein
MAKLPKPVIDRMPQFMRNVKALTTSDVYVGIPMETTERSGDESGPLTNAQIGYIMENGAPEANIPPRPFLVPGVQSVRTQIRDRLATGARAALDGKLDTVRASLAGAGMVAASAVQKKITDGPFAPLADATLRNRASRLRNTKRGFGAGVELERRAHGELPGTEWAKPLVDTGQLLRAVTWVIRARRK